MRYLRLLIILLFINATLVPNSIAFVLPPGPVTPDIDPVGDAATAMNSVSHGISQAQSAKNQVTEVVMSKIKAVQAKLSGFFKGVFSKKKKEAAPGTSKIEQCDIADIHNADSVKAAIYQLFLAYPSDEAVYMGEYRRQAEMFYQDTLLESQTAIEELEKELVALRAAVDKMPSTLIAKDESGQIDENKTFRNYFSAYETIDMVTQVLEELTALKLQYEAARIFYDGIEPAAYNPQSKKKSSSLIGEEKQKFAQGSYKSSEKLVFAQAVGILSTNSAETTKSQASTKRVQEVKEESSDANLFYDEDYYEYDPYNNGVITFEARRSDVASPFDANRDKMAELAKLDPIYLSAQDTLQIHNIIQNLPTYRDLFERYDQYTRLHKKSLEVLGESEKCVLQYLERYYGSNAVKTWSGNKLTGEQVASHHLRKGVSGWAVKTFEIAKANEVMPVYPDNFKEMENPVDETQDLDDLNIINKIKLPEVGNFTNDDMLKIEEKNRKAEMLAWKIGAEAAKMLAKDQYSSAPKWGIATKKFPIWTDLKNYYSQYINGKYDNIKDYVARLDIKPSVHQLVGELLNISFAESHSSGASSTELGDKMLASKQELEKFGFLLGNAFQEEKELEDKKAADTASLYENLSDESKQAIEILKANRDQKLSPYISQRKALVTELDAAVIDLEFYSGRINDIGGEVQSNKLEAKAYKRDIKNMNKYFGDEPSVVNVLEAKTEAYSKTMEISGDKPETNVYTLTTYKVVQEEVDNDTLSTARYSMGSAQAQAKAKGLDAVQLKIVAAEQKDKIKTLEAKIATIDEQMKPINEEYAAAVEAVETGQVNKSDNLAANLAKILEENALKPASEIYKDRLGFVENYYSNAISQTKKDKTLGLNIFDTSEDSTLNSLLGFYGFMGEKARAKQYGSLNTGDYKSTYNQIDSKIAKEIALILKNDKNSSQYHKMYQEKFLKELVDVRLDKISYYANMRIGVAKEVAKKVTEAEGLLTETRNYATQVVDKAREDMFKLEDNLFLAMSHKLVLQRHEELMKELQNLSVKELAASSKNIANLSSHVAVMNVLSTAFQKVILNSVCKDNYCYEADEEYFVGSTGKQRDFKAPKSVPVEYLPPVREVVYFDEIDFNNVPKVAGSNITREGFLGYGAEIPEIWKLILRPNTFVEKDINLNSILNKGGEGLTFLNAGVYPCNSGAYTISVDTETLKYIVNKKIENDKLYKDVPANDYPECREIKLTGSSAFSMGMMYNIYDIGEDVNGTASLYVAKTIPDLLGFKFNVKPKGTIADHTSELGVFLQTKGSRLMFNKVPTKVFSRLNKVMEEENKQNSDYKKNLQDEMFKKASFRRNQFGDFLRFVEVEQGLKQTTDELALSIEEAKKTLFELLRRTGFEPKADLNLAKAEDYNMIKSKLGSIKNKNVTEAFSDMSKVDIVDNPVVEERLAKLNNIFTALRKDKEEVVALTEVSPSDGELDAQIKSETANRGVSEEYRKKSNEEFEKSINNFARPYCAIY